MIRKLRIRFIAVAMATLLFAMAVVLAFVSLIVYSTTSSQYSDILDLLIEGNGNLSGSEAGITIDIPSRFEDLPELIYEARYFCVWTDSEDRVTDIKLSYIQSVNKETAEKLVGRTLRHGTKDHGLLRDGESTYLYKSAVRDDGTRLTVFIDPTSRMWIIFTVIRYTALASLVILLLYFFLYTRYSRRIVKPYIEIQEQQKRFITNASHELKTPLAVISANNEMIEAVSGPSKWTESNSRQISRLTEMIGELVTLTRLEEKEKLDLAKLDWSVICSEEADSFEDVFTKAGKGFDKDIEEGITVNGDDKTLRQLAVIFLDNAAKYCDDGGSTAVSLRASKNKKSASLTVSNSYAEGKDIDYDKFFERFYRQDESHSSSKSGYGIGLSIARQIVQLLGGKIAVSWKDGVISFTVELKTVS